MSTTRHLTGAPLLAALCAAATLVACGKPEDTTVGQKVDQVVAKVEQKADQVGAEVRAGAEKAMDATTDAVRDAAITASVNAALAKDPSLSALRIDVDTSAGRVALKGSAPNAEARDRATQLAMAVDGVRGVDNRLVVAGS